MKYSLIFILILTLSIASCEQKKLDYEQIVKIELANDQRQDSLFLGYRFGMDSDEFFNYSLELNQQELITGQTTTIQYHHLGLSNSSTLHFYPDFIDNKIYKLPMEVSFDGWAPWNKNLYSDVLIEELIDKFEEEFGGNKFFKTIPPDRNQETWVKVDGNRRISIYSADDRAVHIEFLDLSINKD